MPITGRPASFYRPILKAAMRHVFVERDLWIFGIFALAIGSGSALETVLRARNGLEQVGGPFFSQLFPSAEGLRQWLDQFAVLSAPRAVTTIMLATCFTVGVILIGAAAQAIIVRGASKKLAKVRPFSELVSTAMESVPKILIVDVFMKACLVLCVVILLAPPIVQVGFFSDVLITLQTLTSYGLMFAITVTGVFAISSIVNRKLGAVDAILEAFTTFKKHPLTCLELSLILFAINVGMGIVAIAICLILSLFYTFFFIIGAAFGSTLATTISTAITFFTTMAILVVLGGITTAYNYTAIALTYKKLINGHSRSKLSRIARTHHWF